MRDIIKAEITDLDKIIRIDCEVVGHKNRQDYIKNAIELGHCIIAKEKDAIVAFLVYDTNFFECAFISLIIVSPTRRRKGIASQLMDYMCKTSPTIKIFSSTNRSNISMQKVFETNGFVQSGFVENLDEGDPEIIYFKFK
ncbi:GNAT family N-acetyltransferase [Priestia megaterium]|uniref:GNAT family N-acetyltransferase n=1 Tax=Priestia megaterium TaxID=1404 RepID=UPI003D037331